MPAPLPFAGLLELCRGHSALADVGDFLEQSLGPIIMFAQKHITLSHASVRTSIRIERRGSNSHENGPTSKVSLLCRRKRKEDICLGVRVRKLDRAGELSESMNYRVLRPVKDFFLLWMRFFFFPPLFFGLPFVFEFLFSTTGIVDE